MNINEDTIQKLMDDYCDKYLRGVCAVDRTTVFDPSDSNVVVSGTVSTRYLTMQELRDIENYCKFLFNGGTHEVPKSSAFSFAPTPPVPIHMGPGYEMYEYIRRQLASPVEKKAIQDELNKVEVQLRDLDVNVKTVINLALTGVEYTKEQRELLQEIFADYGKNYNFVIRARLNEEKWKLKRKLALYK